MNKHLQYLKGVAIIAVVTNHASLIALMAIFWWTDRFRPVTVPNYDQMNTLEYYGLVAFAKLNHFSVPAFLFVTGMFLIYATRKGQTSVSWKMVKTNLSKLIPAYLIWAGLTLAFQFYFHEDHGIQASLIGLLGIGPAATHWYIPLLIGIYMLSPFIVPLIIRWHRWILPAFSLILLVFMGQTYRIAYEQTSGFPIAVLAGISFSPEIGHYFEYLLYFSLGLIFGYRESVIRPLVCKYRWSLLVIATLSASLAVYEAVQLSAMTGDLSWRFQSLSIPQTVFTISLLLCYMAFDGVALPFFRQMNQISNASMGIYLVHYLIVVIAAKVIYHTAPFIMEYMTIYLPLVVATAIAVPMAMMSVMRKTPLRRYFHILFT